MIQKQETEKPDFKAIGINSWKSKYPELDDHIWADEMEAYAISYRDACEHLWNSYYLPLEIKNSELKKENEELLAALKRAQGMMERDKNGGYRIDYNGKPAHEKGSTYELVSALIQKHSKY